jgi:hypothetical protein
MMAFVALFMSFSRLGKKGEFQNPDPVRRRVNELLRSKIPNVKCPDRSDEMHQTNKTVLELL